MERVKRTLSAILSLEWVVKGRNILAAVLMLTVILVASGLVFVSTGNVATFYGREIFAPSQTVQTVAEFIVVSLYYVLGLTGFVLFYYASTGRLSDRATGYAALGASLLILFSALGLLSGFSAKI
ncbi:MAG: hypothetical protein RMJ28_05500 [Nitrososphaerota archaeon]|nr:hypothetical protein [Candidatus Calditenuaceae archaeon]MDW8073669.1 hypothetical protein [Nitrososphaerota archaeon]